MSISHRRERGGFVCAGVRHDGVIDIVPKRMRRRALKRLHTSKLRMGKCLISGPEVCGCGDSIFLRSRASLRDVDWSRCELSRRGTSPFPLLDPAFNRGVAVLVFALGYGTTKNECIDTWSTSGIESAIKLFESSLLMMTGRVIV